MGRIIKMYIWVVCVGGGSSYSKLFQKIQTYKNKNNGNIFLNSHNMIWMSLVRKMKMGRNCMLNIIQWNMMTSRYTWWFSMMLISGGEITGAGFPYYLTKFAMVTNLMSPPQNASSHGTRTLITKWQMEQKIMETLHIFFSCTKHWEKTSSWISIRII